jgi:hypothetical protein
VNQIQVGRSVGRISIPGKDKVHPRTGQEVPLGEYRYSFTLSLTLAIDGVGGQHYAPAVLPSGNTRHLYIGGRVGPRAGLDGCGKSPPNGILSPDRPARSESLYQLRYPAPWYKNFQVCRDTEEGDSIWKFISHCSGRYQNHGYPNEKQECQ